MSSDATGKLGHPHRVEFEVHWSSYSNDDMPEDEGFPDRDEGWYIDAELPDGTGVRSGSRPLRARTHVARPRHRNDRNVGEGSRRNRRSGVRRHGQGGCPYRQGWVVLNLQAREDAR